MSNIKIILNKSSLGGDVPNREIQSVKDDRFVRSFWFAAGVLASKECLVIKSKAKGSTQKNIEIVGILKKMGADISFSDDVFTIKKSPLKGIEIDLKDSPEIAFILAVVASQASGKTTIKNIETAKNNLEKVIAILRKMGVNVIKTENNLEIEGKKTLKGAVIYPDGDYRTVMAGSLAGLLAEGETVLEDPVCVKETYPDFFDDLRVLGVSPIPITAPFGNRIKFSGCL